MTTYTALRGAALPCPWAPGPTGLLKWKHPLFFLVNPVGLQGLRPRAHQSHQNSFADPWQPGPRLQAAGGRDPAVRWRGLLGLRSMGCCRFRAGRTPRGGGLGMLRCMFQRQVGLMWRALNATGLERRPCAAWHVATPNDARNCSTVPVPSRATYKAPHSAYDSCGSSIGSYEVAAPLALLRA